ncbi:MAG TPA: GTPase [Bacteroidales bacterium]|jgi:predicted GTPase|nr:GTPase [Bacteroidales bacterium]
MKTRRVIICGAAGRDFHNFNVLYRNNPNVKVIAFTATQIPNIDGRKYPAELAGSHYPDGIPIYAESELAELIVKHQVNEVLFSYSDVTYTHVMQIGAIAQAAGAKFSVASPTRTMVESVKPVVSVCAVRTGCGKSQTSRIVSDVLTNMGKKVVAIRHPMPYGDLVAQKVQRFASVEDLKKHKCTIEEMEEYEPHIDRGRVIYAGVDYEAIVREAEKEADIILWDGGNNDTPFYKADLEIVVVDPHRVGHELLYYPGQVNFLRADVIVINKVDSASTEDVVKLEAHIKLHNPKATVIKANSKLILDAPDVIKDKKVLVVEDGPTLTHGEMKYGAGVVAAKKYGAAEIIDPRPYTTGTISETFEKYPEIGTLLPAMGYGEKQIQDLQDTINKVQCDSVVIGTPIDLNRIVSIDKPTVRVQYELDEITSPNLKTILTEKFS